jgi:hypothetical protein
MAIWFKEVSQAIDTHVANAEIVALYQRWRAARASGTMPAAEDFGVAALPEYAPRLMVLQAEGNDFLYRHYGAEIRQHSELDMTDQRVTEFGGELGRYFLDCYRRVGAGGKPPSTSPCTPCTFRAAPRQCSPGNA